MSRRAMVTQGHVQPGAVVVLRRLVITEARRGPVESGIDVLGNPDLTTRGEDWLRELDPPGRVDRAHAHAALVMLRRRGRIDAPSRLAWTEKREGEHQDEPGSRHRFSDDRPRTDRSREVSSQRLWARDASRDGNSTSDCPSAARAFGNAPRAVGGGRSGALIGALAPGLRVHTGYPRPVHDHGLLVAWPRRQGRDRADKGHVRGAAVLKGCAERDVDTHAQGEPGDALLAVRRAPPVFSLAREDVPVLVDGPEMAGAANHPWWHGRVDHVAVRPVHQETDMSSQGRAAALRRFDGGGLHVVTPVKGQGKASRSSTARVAAGSALLAPRGRKQPVVREGYVRRDRAAAWTRQPGHFPGTYMVRASTAALQGV